MAKEQTFHDILNDYWGYREFRPMQLDVIRAVSSGHDILALMPTGGGKSLLYQVPALAMEGVCIVVTPLIALMKDQVDTLKLLGISAASIHSGLTTRQIDFILDNACWGDLKFLYVAPERLSNYTFRERLRGMEVSILAIDEAHCISQWGYDFRPSYLRIAEIREMIPDTPVLALTASATPLVADDIMRNLNMKEGRIMRSSFARPNLSFVVRDSDDKRGQLMRVIENIQGSGIVYVRTRKMVEELAKWLIENGVSAEDYHAGMTYFERTEKQENWMRGEVRVMVSTNAFGMGIDKADVRFVVHYDLPDSPEAYYQEAGRAGRDGARSYAVLLTSSDDRGRFLRRFQIEYPPIEQILSCYEAIFNYLQIGIEDGKYASFNFNVYDFAAQFRMYTSTALSAINILQQNGYLTLTDETDNPPRIMFIVGRDELYRVQLESSELDHIIRTLLRLYSGIFNYRLVAINEDEISHASGYSVEKVRDLLKQLWQLRIMRYVPGSRSPILLLHEQRLPTKDVFISPESYKIRKEMSTKRVESMFEYAEEQLTCRSLFFQRYFGDTDSDECGICDNCIERRKSREGGSANREQESGELSEKIIKLVGFGDYSVKDVVSNFRHSPEEIIEVIDGLIESGIISIGKDGKVSLE